MASLPILLKTHEFDFLGYKPNPSQAKKIRRAMCPGPYLDAVRDILGITGCFGGGYSWKDSEGQYARTEFQECDPRSVENKTMLDRDGVFLEQTISAAFAGGLNSLVTIGIGLRLKDDRRSLSDDYHSKLMPYHMAINVHFQSTLLEEDPIEIGGIFNRAPDAILTLARNHNLIRLATIYERALKGNEDLIVPYLKSLYDAQETYTHDVLPKILEQQSVEMAQKRVKEYEHNHYR